MMICFLYNLACIFIIFSYEVKTYCYLDFKLWSKLEWKISQTPLTKINIHTQGKEGPFTCEHT